MKSKIKILLSVIAMIAYVSVSAQVSNVADFRIADATTAFGKNLPVGTKVYNIATGDYFVATAGVASTATLTTASGSFDQLNVSGTDDQTIDVFELSGTDLNLSLENDGEATKTVDLSSLQDGTGTDDQTASEVDVTDAGGYFTGTEVETALQELGADVAVNNAKVSNVTTNLGVGSKTGTTLDITSSDGTDATVPAVTTSEAGLMTASDKQKLNGIDSGAEVNLTAITETFEEANGTPTAHSLAQTAVTAQGCRVSLNGATLSPDDYTLTTSTITLDGPVMQYDQVTITYWY